ncbi:MAG: DUF3341 domain-containing protein [Deltaproteobacteria bacterium]|nr:DUF3341 domain-containing protein [Deltaproteobacteria bacterium]
MTITRRRHRGRFGRRPMAEHYTPFAVVGYFDTPAQLYHACEGLRDAGYKNFDAHTPFAVHGLEKAMGLRPSKLPWVVLTCGTLGLLGGILLAWYTQAYDYPQNISGKQPFSYQAYVPIFFELTVLLAAFGAFFGLWTLNKQPAFYHPVMKHPSFPRASDDKFLLSIETSDPMFHATETRNFLEKLGAQEIQEVAS